MTNQPFFKWNLVGGWAGLTFRKEPDGQLYFIYYTGSWHLWEQDEWRPTKALLTFAPEAEVFRTAGIPVETYRQAERNLNSTFTLDLSLAAEAYWSGGAECAFFYCAPYSQMVQAVQSNGVVMASGQVRENMANPITKAEALARLNENAAWQGIIPNPSFRFRFGVELDDLITHRSQLRFGTVRAKFNEVMPRDLDAAGEREWLKSLAATATSFVPQSLGWRLITRAEFENPPPDTQQYVSRGWEPATRPLRSNLTYRTMAPLPTPLPVPAEPFRVASYLTQTERVTLNRFRRGSTTEEFSLERIREMLDVNEGDLDGLISDMEEEASNAAEDIGTDYDSGDDEEIDTEITNTETSADVSRSRLIAYLRANNVDFND